MTTTGMVTDLVRQIAGEHAEIVGLMGEGIDPHLYRPTTQDSARLMQADFVLYSGLKLEGQMGAALELARKQGRQIVAVTDGLPPDEIRYPSGAVGHPDPHVWHDPVLWGECARRVAMALGEYDPANATDYSRRAAEVHAECTRFHEHAAQVLGAIPEQQRHLVTAHDAFEYFARRYGLTVHSVQGITTESEPGLQDTNALVDFLVDQKIPALFVETTVNPDHLKAVIEGAAARDWEVSIGGTLYSDAMGAPGTREGTYLGMLDHNVVTIARELGSTWEGPLSFFDVAEDSKMETENHTTAAPKLE
ncbi:MAG: zinc ABC transporter substrate-binding protein [Planctomycetaceae bacterium]|nr:zinc ABC transporter substrate-binding protein [Planctomycetaceae bacterium]